MKKHELVNVRVIERQGEMFKTLRLVGFNCIDAKKTVFSILNIEDEDVRMLTHYEKLFGYHNEEEKSSYKP